MVNDVSGWFSNLFSFALGAALAISLATPLHGQDGLADVNSRVNDYLIDYLAGIEDWPHRFAFIARGTSWNYLDSDADFSDREFNVLHLGLVSSPEKLTYHGSCWRPAEYPISRRGVWDETLESGGKLFGRFGDPRSWGDGSTDLGESSDRRSRRLHPKFEPYFMPIATGGAFKLGSVDRDYGLVVLNRDKDLWKVFSDQDGNLVGVFSSPVPSQEPGRVAVSDITFSKSAPHFPIRCVHRFGQVPKDFDLKDRDRIFLEVRTDSTWKTVSVQGRKFSVPIHIRQFYQGSQPVSPKHELELFFKYSFSIRPDVDLPKATDADWRQCVLRHIDDDANPVFSVDLHGDLTQPIAAPRGP